MKSTKQRFATFLTRCLGVAVLAAGGLVLPMQTASAVDNGPTQTGEICMQRVFGTPVTNSNRLNCTANDIRLSKAISVSPASCTRGTTFNLTATFETIVTANARYDAGFFFRIDGGPNARGDGAAASGVCSLSALKPPPPPNSPALNLDGDTCGDLNSGTYNVTFTIPDVVCEAAPGTNQLKLPNCTSWHSNWGTTCNIETASTFNPDTKSKCVCDDNFTVPVTVEEATISVTKDVSPTQVPEPGGTVTYTVAVTNTASIEPVTIASIIDDPYGNLGTNTPSYVDNTCPNLIGDVLVAGASTSCSFKAPVSGNAGDRVTDEVEVCVTQAGVSAQICGTDPADVDITDVYTAPTLSKTAQSTANCQLDATYQVVVSNNSSVDSLTVVSLTDDKFGDITTAHAAGGGYEAVQSTLCATGGNIAPLDNYTCTFVGRIVSASCDISHTNEVTADVTDDDDHNNTLTDDALVSVSTTP